MPLELRYEDNPFESPIKARASVAPTTVSNPRTQEPDILATADRLLEQLKELEHLCSTVEERVQRKRRALKELEYLILGPNGEEGSPCSPLCPSNTPISARLQRIPPRLRGLFDLRGPGQVNVDATQTCLDYSTDTLMMEDDASTREDPGHSEEWVDDDDQQALLSGSPFDDQYALQESPVKVEKKLPAVPRETGSEVGSEVLESKIPRKVYVRRQVSASRKRAGLNRPPSAVARTASHRRHPSVRSVKAKNAVTHLPVKGTMRRGSWKRSIMENVRVKGGSKSSSAIENEGVKENTRRKEKRKGLWSIYSVCSEIGLSGTPRAI